MNGWNLTESASDIGIMTCYKTSLDFVNISETVISWRLFFSYSGPWGDLCHTDTFLVSSILLNLVFVFQIFAPDGVTQPNTVRLKDFRKYYLQYLKIQVRPISTQNNCNFFQSLHG